MSIWQEYDLDVNGVKMHYLRTGGAKPPVVLLHGFSDSALDWRRIIHALAPDYDVIGIDTRGHGGSDLASPGYTIQQQASDTAGVIRGLGLQKPAVLGHSMGAITAIHLAAQEPDLLSCILLEDPPLIDPDPDYEGFNGWENSAKAFKTLPFETQMQHARDLMPGVTEEEQRDWVNSQMKFDVSLFQEPMFLALPDWRVATRQLTIPGLLIIGDNLRGAIVSQAAAQEMASLWSGVRVVHIENAGHGIRRDQPDRYIEVVRAYLKEKFA